ncbi:MAG: MaoC/PaaZ C-terminal domain-containing protein [Polyangiaceae bacterium]
MSLKPEALGAESAVYSLPYDWKTLVLYALGIGAKRDELDYLYEARGPKVYPTFAVVPTYQVLMDLMAKSGGSFERVVHGGQSIRVHAPLPPTGVMSTSGVITGVYDLKRMGQLVFQTRTLVEGRLIYESEWSLIFLGDGGFGGPRPPKSSLGKVPDGVEPAFTFQETIAPEQALVYRLSGDLNPLHADPQFAALVGFDQGPILHGLATYGFCARALIKAELGGDASRLVALDAQFKKPVWPGEALRTVGYKVGEEYALKAYAGGRDEPVALLTARVT